MRLRPPCTCARKRWKSYKKWVLRLPVRLGGFGFRSLEVTVDLAFIGALDQAVPAFCGAEHC